MLKFPQAFQTIRSKVGKDKRFGKLRLENGIKFCLISDPKAPSGNFKITLVNAQLPPLFA